MLSLSFCPYNFPIYTARKCTSFLPHHSKAIFICIVVQENATISEHQDSEKYFSFKKKSFKKMQSDVNPVWWTKGLGVERITFGRIVLYWKVTVSVSGESVWGLADLPSLENHCPCRSKLLLFICIVKDKEPLICLAWGMAVSPEDQGVGSAVLPSAQQCVCSGWSQLGAERLSQRLSTERRHS